MFADHMLTRAAFCWSRILAGPGGSPGMAGGIEVIRCSKKTGPLAGGLALAIGLTLVAPPAFATEAQAPAPTAPVRPTLAAAAAAKVEAMPAAALAQAAPVVPAPTTSSDKPFLKSGKGAVAMVLMGSILGYMAYSFSHDRVKSPAK